MEFVQFPILTILECRLWRFQMHPMTPAASNKSLNKLACIQMWYDNRFSYLWFKHIAHKEYHHTCVDFVLHTPKPPSWNLLSNWCPNVIWRNNGQNKQHFYNQNDFRQIEIDAWWIIIGAIDNYLWIFFTQDICIFFKCFTITTWVAETIQMNTWLMLLI